MDKTSFVFYDSFWESTKDLPDDVFIRVIKGLIKKSLFDTEPDLSPLENSLINQMFVNVKVAHERYEKAKADGATGGRPGIKIAPEEWQAYRDEHTQKETAEHFGISIDTLQRWEKKTGYRKTAKPQNLTDTVTDTVTVTDTDTDTVTSIYKNINSRSRRGASEAPSLPALKEGERWVTDPYKMADGRIAADFMLDTGEERTMIISEP